jgi:hypothetical protein
MEYCSPLNQGPFVILPSLGIIYLKEANNATFAGTKGCHIHPRMANQLQSELQSHILDGHDVSLRITGNVYTFRVVDDTGDLVEGLSPFVKPWDYFKETTVKIQRFLKAKLWRIRKPTHHLKHIKAFQGSDMAKLLPTEIFSKVAEFYFQPQIHTLAKTSIQRSVFGRGHMKIFANLE